MTTRTGRCLCGAITYTAEGLDEHGTACHCDMCRRWSGGPFLAIGCERVVFEGEESLRVVTTSDWSERGFCGACGSGLFYRITVGSSAGKTNLAIGTLDDQSGITLDREFFIDRKPALYALEGERTLLTEADIKAMYSGG